MASKKFSKKIKKSKKIKRTTKRSNLRKRKFRGGVLPSTTEPDNNPYKEGVVIDLLPFIKKLHNITTDDSVKNLYYVITKYYTDKNNVVLVCIDNDSIHKTIPLIKNLSIYFQLFKKQSELRTLETTTIKSNDENLKIKNLNTEITDLNAIILKLKTENKLLENEIHSFQHNYIELHPDPSDYSLSSLNMNIIPKQTMQINVNILNNYFNNKLIYNNIDKNIKLIYNYGNKFKKNYNDTILYTIINIHKIILTRTPKIEYTVEKSFDGYESKQSKISDLKEYFIAELSDNNAKEILNNITNSNEKPLSPQT